jgi:hypothetical protein
MVGKATWDKLFEPPNFFVKYKYVGFWFSHLQVVMLCEWITYISEVTWFCCY